MKRRGSFLALLLIVAASALSVTLSSCGTDEPVAASIPRISDPGTLMSFTDLQDIGFKKSKQYDVERMTGATAVYYGFWGPDPYSREDYEVRFFPSHSDAVELGVALVEERVGKDAKLVEENSNWPVALKDARRCTGSKAYSGPQNCLTPKYWDYSIYSNMIVLCSGGDVETAAILCNDLLTALQPAADDAQPGGVTTKRPRRVERSGPILELSYAELGTGLCKDPVENVDCLVDLVPGHV